MAERAFFLDRDGTINEDSGYISDPGDIVIIPGAAEAIRLINESGFKCIVITNQSGIARGMYTEEMLDAVHTRMIELLSREGAHVDAIYYCPHHPEAGSGVYRLDCDCRKPRPGLLLRAAREHGIDIQGSYMIGDKTSDIELARNAGARPVLVLTGTGRTALEELGSESPDSPDVAMDLLDAVTRLLGHRNRPGSPGDREG